MQIVNDPNQPAANTQTEQEHQPRRQRYILTGLALISVGVIFLMDRADIINTPIDYFSWEFILILVGVHLAEKNNFTGISWVACIAIGAWFLLDGYLPDFNLRYYFAPLLIIGIGLYVLVGRKSTPSYKYKYKYNYNYKASKSSGMEAGIGADNASNDDYIDVVSIFGGTNKNIIAKQFKGGEAVSIFGGTELNLLKADFEGRAVLDLTQVFGGCTVIVPPHWDIKTEMVSIFGGVEDARHNGNVAVDPTKVLVIKGTSIFGGIEIKSY